MQIWWCLADSAAAERLQRRVPPSRFLSSACMEAISVAVSLDGGDSGRYPPGNEYPSLASSGLFFRVHAANGQRWKIRSIALAFSTNTQVCYETISTVQPIWRSDGTSTSGCPSMSTRLVPIIRWRAVSRRRARAHCSALPQIRAPRRPSSLNMREGTGIMTVVRLKRVLKNSVEVRLGRDRVCRYAARH